MTPILSSTLLRTQSDARLVALAGRGGERAFEAIVERYRRPLLRWCKRVLPESRAEDAVQTTFLKAWTALQSGAEVEELRPWLYRIARNAALDNARKSGYDYEELNDALRIAPGPQDELERRQVIRQTLAGVAGLPENQREALLQTAAGHSRAEIARQLDLSEGAVRQLVHRARSSLRAAATALTPTPLAGWAAALGSEGAGTQRIAELAAGAGSAGIAASAVKAGTVVVAAGVLAVGPGAALRHEAAKDSKAAASQGQPKGGDDQVGDDQGGDSSGAGTATAGEDRGEGGRKGRGRGENRGGARRGRDDRGDDDHGGSRRSGSSGGGDHSEDSGRHRSGGSERSGHDGGDDRAESGDSGSGEDHSGSGDSGSGEDHSGSGDSGSRESSSSEDHSRSGDSGSSGGENRTGSGESASGSGSDALPETEH